MSGIARKLMGVTKVGGAFDPSQLASTLAWYDASDASTVTYDGSNNVSAWDDKIASVSVTRTASSAVTYNVGGGYLTFTNPSAGLVNRTTRFGLAANPDIFVAAVFEVADNLEKRVFTIGDLNVAAVLIGATDISWRFNNGNRVFVEDVTTNAPELLVWQRSAGSNYGASTAFLNGTELTGASSSNPTNVPTNTVAEFGIGTGFNETDIGDFDGDLFELIICESDTQSDRQKIEGYLSHKHGLTANLPADHPYKTTAP